MKFPVAEATAPYTLDEVPLWPDDVEMVVTEVIGNLSEHGQYGPDDRRLAADLVRFALMSLDVLEFAYTAGEKRDAFGKIDRSLGERLEWLYTALIVTLRAQPPGFDEALKNRVIGAFLSVSTVTQEVLAS